MNSLALSRQAGSHQTRGSSSFEKRRRLIWVFIFMVNINSSAFCQNRASGSLMSTDRWGKMKEVTTSVARSCQRHRLNGFRPLVNPFSNVLTFPQPPPSSVLLTMPGSSLDPHLPLCFLNCCFPLWFFLFFSSFFQSTQLIRAPSKQIRAQGHTQTLGVPCKHFTSDSSFQRIHVKMHVFDFYKIIFQTVTCEVTCVQKDTLKFAAQKQQQISPKELQRYLL